MTSTSVNRSAATCANGHAYLPRNGCTVCHRERNRQGGEPRLDYSTATHCPAGHDLREPGTLYTDGAGRNSCGECRRKRDRDRKRVGSAIRCARGKAKSKHNAEVNAVRGRPPAPVGGNLSKRDLAEQSQIQARLLWLGDQIARGLRKADELAARAEMALLSRRVRL